MFFTKIASHLFSKFAPSGFAIPKHSLESSQAEAILNPNWLAVEKHFEASVPSILKEFYSDANLVLQTSFQISSKGIKISEGIHIQSFEPINEKSVDGFFEGFENYLTIAWAGGGGLYVIDISELDPRVYLHIYDIGLDPDRFRFTGLKLSQFLTAKTSRSFFE